MKKCFDESRYVPLGLPGPTEERKSVDVGDSGLFPAVYDLDKDKVEVILGSGAVDVNSVYSFGGARVSGRPDEHMRETFGSAKCGKITCQLFEKIDQANKATHIFNLLQFLVAGGLTLDNVVYDRPKEKFNESDSEYFWFTVLRKLYIYCQDSEKEKSWKAYTDIANYLEENIFKNSEQYGRLARTAAFYVAVEKGNTEMVEDMLNKFEGKFSNNVFTHVRALPGLVFPSGSYYNDPIMITPVAVALRRQDVKMLSLLCSHPWGKLPMFKGHPEVERNKVVSLCLDILKDDNDFFKNPVLTNLLDQQPDQRITSQCYSTSSVKWSVSIAEVFRAVEEVDIERVKKLFKENILLSQIVRETYVSGRSPMVEENDLDNLWITNLVFEKSIVLTALERQNMKILEFLETNHFDLTDLGRECQYQGNSKDRNKMFMWYQLIKYLLKIKQQVFVYNLCKKNAIWQGPAIVGCLFTAARREDLELMKEIAAHYSVSDVNWFYGPKFHDNTAHGLLIKEGFLKEGKLLQTYLVDFPTQSRSRFDVEYSISSAKSLEDFKALVEDNPELLIKPTLSDKTLVMLCMSSKGFTVEKFEYLLTEKMADIERVITSANSHGTKVNFLDILLEDICNTSQAALLLNILQHEEVQEMIFNTSNFLSNLATKIGSFSNAGAAPDTIEVKRLLLECFKLIVNIASLEVMFFPTRSNMLGNPVIGLFEVIKEDPELFDIAAERAFNLIGKEEKKVAALTHLICVHFKSCIQDTIDSGKQIEQEKGLALFETFFKNLQEETKREQAGYDCSLEHWRDTHGMTFLMRLLIEADVKFNVDSRHAGRNIGIFLQWIIEGEYFDNDYINLVVDNLDLATQFNLQHRHGVVSANKERNTIISDGQLIKVKRVTKQNQMTGQYEMMEADKDGQTKMISEKRVKVQEHGLERDSRFMVTVKKPATIYEELSYVQDRKEDATVKELSQNNHKANNQCDDYERDGEEDLGEPIEAVSRDGDESEGEENRGETTLGLPTYDNAKKVGEWALENIIKADHSKIVVPEHFDKTSVITDTDETFRTQKNKYKIAPSASTRFLETHSTVEKPSLHYAKRTTVLLLACKTRFWDIVPSLIKKYVLDVNHKDAAGSNALHLAVSAGKAEICKIMIPHIKIWDLKSEVNVENKNALMLVTELMKKWTYDSSYKVIENLILDRLGLKQNPYTIQKKGPLDNTIQKLLLHGSSCGFQFQEVGGVWQCRGEGCQVQVILDGDQLRAEDKSHYTRHTCGVAVYVEEKRNKHSMWKMLDQFKFIYLEDSAEIIDDADTEVWECTKEGCAANVEVNNETNRLVGHSGQHNCDTILKMEINRDLAHLDEFMFLKEDSTEEIPISKCHKGHHLAPCDVGESRDWICDNCDKRSNENSWRCSEDKRKSKEGRCNYDLCSTCAQQSKDTAQSSRQSTWRCQGAGCKGEKKGCKIQVYSESLELVRPNHTKMHRCKKHVKTEEAK